MDLEFKQLGLINYPEAIASMLDYTLSRNTYSSDQIWFCEHHPVYTLGLAADKNNILNKTSIPIIQTDRGGDITYHGPGQLMIYCLLDLRRNKLGIKKLINNLENIITASLEIFNIQPHTIHNQPGVFVQNKKICSMGLGVKNHCTYHGLALNINMDLKPFNNINPCGYKNLRLTQCKEHGLAPTFNQLIPILMENINDCFRKESSSEAETSTYSH